MPNVIQKLPIWPGCHAFPKTADPVDNKKTCFAFSLRVELKSQDFGPSSWAIDIKIAENTFEEKFL